MINFVECGDYEFEYHVSISSERANNQLHDIFEWAKEYGITGFIHSLGIDDGIFVVGLKSRDLVTEFMLKFG